MKTLFKVLAVIAFLVASGSSLLVGVRNSVLKEDAPTQEQIAALEEQLTKSKELAASSPELQESVKELETTLEQVKGVTADKFNTSNLLSFFASLVAIVALVFVFVKGGRLIAVVGGIAVLVAVLSWVLAVNVEPGLTGGANPKSIALTALIATVIAVAFGFLGKKPAEVTA